tara:strand:- start:893 stop:1435 length:543 start_codon:yes stop_codon:yes gene_type:complete
MKDIVVKPSICFEKKIQKHIFYYESILKNVNTKHFIKGIDAGINLDNNMNYRTNVHGKMTSWTYFNKNEHLNDILSKCLDVFDLDFKLPSSFLAESWGIKMNKNAFTKEHDHAACSMSGVLYLNTLKNCFLEFPELNYKTEIIKNKIILFSSSLLHKTKRISSNYPKYAVAFNFKRKRDW